MRLLILALLVLMVSCTKDSVYPKLYTKHSLEVGEVKMFVRGMEITDAALINSFIARQSAVLSQGNSHSLVFDSDEDKYNQYDFSVEIQSAADGRFLFPADSILKFNVSPINNINYFAFGDIIHSLAWGADNRFKLNPELINSTLVPGGTLYEFYQTVFAIEVDDQLRFPLISYIEGIWLNGELMVVEAKVGANNLFSEEYLTRELPQNYQDTIVFRQSWVVYIE